MSAESESLGRVPQEVSWSEVEEYTRELALKIADSGFEPDWIIGISRGGWEPAIKLAHLMRWKPFASIDVKKDGERRYVDKNPHINWNAFSGQKVLLMEDMLETGRSADVARVFLQEHGVDVRIGCYFSRNDTEVQPDYVLKEGLPETVKFPWERFRETR